MRADSAGPGLQGAAAGWSCPGSCPGVAQGYWEPDEFVQASVDPWGNRQVAGSTAPQLLSATACPQPPGIWHYHVGSAPAPPGLTGLPALPKSGVIFSSLQDSDQNGLAAIRVPAVVMWEGACRNGLGEVEAAEADRDFSEDDKADLWEVTEWAVSEYLREASSEPVDRF